jgi:uncharacterized repeat protein (TIGR03806 family)
MQLGGLGRMTVAALSALAACGGGKGSHPDVDAGPTPSEFGLDVRPANASCVARDRPVLNTGVTLQRRWAGITFNEPVYLTQAPGDNTKWYVVELIRGTVRVFPDNATTDAQVADFVTVPVNAGGEGGLLGFAFHPQWPTKREAYLSYTRNVVSGDPAPPTCSGSGNPFTSVVSRFASSNGGVSLNVGPDEILKVGQPYDNHDGGNLQFGLDGMLYFGLGDGGSGNDPCGSGQSLTTLLGKMLRLDINAPAGMYKIPADNPFATSTTARKEIWSYGHRNPWRWSFDKSSGELWVGDVGQGTWEEIDRVVKGGNYGWKTCEGLHRLGSTTELCNTPGLLDPVVEHGRADAQSITGGYVYRGTAMPSLVGTYIYGDYVTGNIWALTYDLNNKPKPKVISTVAARTLVSFAQGNDGELYTVQVNGVLSKLVPSAPPPPDSFPQLLSATGCVDATDPHKPAPGVIPYDVASPLWSDGAAKARFFAIPDGTTIAINPEQDWELPIGSVVMKTFALAGKPLETRLFMRHKDGGWAGYTYEWNEAGSDAALLPAGKVKDLGAGSAWGYPSRTQCLQCHSQAAGGTIGLETAQLNRDAVYPATNRLSNQLTTLDHIGMLTTPLTTPVAELPRLSDPAGTDSLEQRARAYLHANCAHCHRPMGGGQGTMDLRSSVLFKDTKTCNAANTQGDVEGATKLIVPGAPEQSVLSRRVHANDAKRMPPVAVNVIDPAGAKLIDDWIASLTACP